MFWQDGVTVVIVFSGLGGVKIVQWRVTEIFGKRQFGPITSLPEEHRRWQRCSEMAVTLFRMGNADLRTVDIFRDEFDEAIGGAWILAQERFRRSCRLR